MNKARAMIKSYSISVKNNTLFYGEDHIKSFRSHFKMLNDCSLGLLELKRALTVHIHLTHYNIFKYLGNHKPRRLFLLCSILNNVLNKICLNQPRRDI